MAEEMLELLSIESSKVSIDTPHGKKSSRIFDATGTAQLGDGMSERRDLTPRQIKNRRCEEHNYWQ